MMLIGMAFLGGCNAPHLRTELWRSLIRAEAMADHQIPGSSEPRVESLDYDSDGAPELLFSAPDYQALLKPSDGGTLAAVDFRPASAALINSVLRRPEAYHARLRSVVNDPSAPLASIHEQTRVKEPGLDRFLHYDRWARHAFRLFFFDPTRTQASYERLELHEDSAFAGGVFQIDRYAAQYAELVREGALEWQGKDARSAVRLSVRKHFSFDRAPRGCELACEVRLALGAALKQPVAVGIESVINLLAPGEPDRFVETASGPQNLRFSGCLPGSVLRLEDGWQRLRIALQAPLAEQFWIAPIETVSESEEGFERVYQGSQILAVWKPDLSAARTWVGRLVWRVESL